MLETIVHRLVALDPDVSSDDSLDFAATEPITAVDKDGKEVIQIIQAQTDRRELFAAIAIKTRFSEQE